ncbi:hypothetical protein XENORESO_003077 [Xenotaenia resolanae]|uniref:Uncharacterized protein n=1 Tax=Xenotaenia resolanae TaxID=208358 RepID=A0ABV0WVF3_9TELE
MGSFRGMLCPLRSVCWSMLPAFPIFAPLKKKTQAGSHNFLPSCLLEKNPPGVYWKYISHTPFGFLPIYTALIGLIQVNDSSSFSSLK